MGDQHDDLIAEALVALGYDGRRLADGCVDAPFLREQLTGLRSGDEQGAEHDRYAAFLRLLKGRRDIDELSVARYLELAALNRDRTMAASALIQLAQLPGLTGEQRRWLRAQPALAAPVVQRTLDRAEQKAQSGKPYVSPEY